MRVGPVGSPGVGAAAAPFAESDARIGRIMEAESAPLTSAQARQDRDKGVRDAFQEIGGLLDDLGGSANKLKMPGDFSQYKVESSHPDILEGAIEGPATPGSFELEIKGLAQSDKHLEFGFPDADKTEVGFGHLAIERADGQSFDVTLEPGSTLKDAAEKINASGAGVRAQVVDTGQAEDPFKLLVSSVETGEAARLSIDTDTSFLEFRNIKPAANLEATFDDVAVQRAGNELKDLVQGVKLNAKRAEPGTRVTVNVTPDVDKTLEGVKEFTDKYNKIQQQIGSQYAADPETGRLGQLAGDSSLRSLQRSMQNAVSGAVPAGASFGSLAEIGITTNAKSGELMVDEQKLKAALAKDYDGVAAVFTVTENGQGLAARLSDTVRALQDPQSGALASRTKSLDRAIRDQDKVIERQSQRLAEKRERVTQQLADLDGKVAQMNAQGSFLAARLGQAVSPGGAG